MRYNTEEDEDTRKEDGLQEKETNTKEMKSQIISKSLQRVFKQLFIRGFLVFLFYWIFLFVLQYLKGSVVQYENSGKCSIGEK